MAFGAPRGSALTGFNGSPGTGIQATGSVSVSLGDLIVVGYGVAGTPANLSFTDNLGNTYNLLTPATAGTGKVFGAWAYVAYPGTLTYVQSAHDTTNADASLVAVAYEGPFKLAPLDKDINGPSADSTSPYPCPATGTLAQANELVIGMQAQTRGAASYGATSPFTLAGNIGTGTGANTSSLGQIYLVVAATTTVTPEVTSSANYSASVYTASFMQGTPPLVATALTVGSPGIGTAAFTQKHALAATALTTAGASVPTATLTQKHVLVATSLAVAGPSIGAPTFEEMIPNIPLDPTGLTVASPSLGVPSLGQAHVLSPTSLEVSGPQFGAPNLLQSHVLTATSLAVAGPVLGQGALTQLHELVPVGLTVAGPVLSSPSLSSGVVLIMGGFPLDFGLSEFKPHVDKILVCSDMPTDYADALAKEIGEKDFGAGNVFGDPFDGTPGRSVTAAAVDGGETINPGQVVCWAAIDSANSTLFARGPLTGGASLLMGQAWGLESFTIHLPGT